MERERGKERKEAQTAPKSGALQSRGGARIEKGWIFRGTSPIRKHPPPRIIIRPQS